MTDPRQEVENRRAWRLTFLHSLYEWSDGNPAVILRSIWSIGDELGIPSEQVEELRAELVTLQAQLASPRPRLAAVREAATGIRDVLEGLARSGKAARDALPLLESARSLLGRMRT